MEQYIIKNNITLLCVKAVSFPEGIAAAFDTLHTITGREERTFYGISYPEKNGKIIYRAAAAEKYEGEAARLHCESFTVKKGNYVCIVVKDFMKNIPAVGNAFTKLLSQPGIDPEGYCLEMYEGAHDVRCLVPLKK